MPSHFREADSLADRIESLREPYRQNAIRWLEMCMQQPILNPRADLLRFLGELNPVVRESFFFHALRVLDEAVHFFGIETGAMSPLRLAC